MTGEQAEAIAQNELQRLGYDIGKMRLFWDEHNSSWRRWVGEDTDLGTERNYTKCGYWAVGFSPPPASRLPSPSDPPGTVAIRVMRARRRLFEMLRGNFERLRRLPACLQDAV